MKRTLFLSIVIVFVISIVGCDSKQTPTKEQSSITDKNIKQIYDLQQKCGKRSEEWFKNKYGGSGDIHLMGYENHYNKKMNKCFILVSKKLDDYSLSIDLTQEEHLFDVDENKEYGSVVFIKGKQSTCYFIDGKEKDCEKYHWINTIHPYMND